MNTDIRLSVGFWDHPKIVKLERRLGLEGVKSLQILWLWAAQNRPDGVLDGMDAEDIEIAAKWNGVQGSFKDALTEINAVDFDGENYILHGWKEHNEWQASSHQRSDSSRFNRMAKTYSDIYEKLKALGVKSFVESLPKAKKSYRVREIIEITRGHYGSKDFEYFFSR